MIDIRPVTDLQDNFAAIESAVNDGRTVYLTKNGYGSMVVMSVEQFSLFADNDEGCLPDFIERKLDEAEKVAETTTDWLSGEDAFERVRKNAGLR